MHRGKILVTLGYTILRYDNKSKVHKNNKLINWTLLKFKNFYSLKDTVKKNQQISYIPGRKYYKSHF